MFSVKVDLLVGGTIPIYKDTWDETIEYMMNDTYHRSVIESLMRELDVHGGFRMPVRTGREEVEDENGNYVPGFNIQVQNGTHRVIATLKHPKVNYITVVDESEEQDYGNLYLNTNIVVVNHDIPEDELDEVLDNLLFISAPLTESVWLTTEGGSVKTVDGNTVVSIVWDFSEKEIADVDTDSITKFISNVVAELGLTAASVETVTEDLSEED